MTTLVCVFDSLSNAEEARRELMESGLNLAHVDIVSRSDDPESIEDDFAVEEQKNAKRTGSGRRRQSSRGGTIDSDDFKPTVKHAAVMMTVETQSDADTSRARALIGRLGGTDIDFRTSSLHH